MNYNEPDNKTTQIPSFLRGTESANLKKNNFEELPKPQKKMIEIPEENYVSGGFQKNDEVVIDKPKQKDEVKRPKRKKETLHPCVKVMSVVVAIAFVLYLGINVYWIFTGGPKVAASVPKQTQAPVVVESETPIVTPENTQTAEVMPEESVPSNMGTVTILAEMIKKRVEPSLSAQDVGAVYTGDKYTVSAIQEADGYTWYQIDDGTWIASDVNWVEYAQN